MCHRGADLGPQQLHNIYLRVSRDPKHIASRSIASLLIKLKSFSRLHPVLLGA
jgi:hypothetical protein